MGRNDSTWKGTVPGPDGNPLDITYAFDLSGYNLNGSVSTKLGGGPFYGCKVKGNKISFNVQGPDGIVHLNGTLSGDVINMIQKNGDDVKKSYSNVSNKEMKPANPKGEEEQIWD